LYFPSIEEKINIFWTEENFHDSYGKRAYNDNLILLVDVGYIKIPCL
jgi:hypothetical protein